MSGGEEEELKLEQMDPIIGGDETVFEGDVFAENQDEDRDDGNGNDDEDDDDDDDSKLQKLKEGISKNIISEFHPDLQSIGETEVASLTKVIRDKNGVIIDEFHRTIPFVTKYEKARILGERARQINAGAEPMVEVDDEMIDGYLIALKEFTAKKTPFILKRPLPDGRCEYWCLADLEIL